MSREQEQEHEPHFLLGRPTCEDDLLDELFCLDVLMKSRHQQLMQMVRGVKDIDGDQTLVLRAIEDKNEELKDVHKMIDDMLGLIRSKRRKLS